MTQNLSDLLKQRAELEAQIEKVQREARSGAIAKVRELMQEYGLTLSDISGGSSKNKAASGGAKVAPKYRNAETGETWSGRGLKPKWLATAVESGKSLTDFLIA